MNKYVIIHGQLHELSEDELMHWKYIKREKVNGKWKYYYDLGEKEKQNYETAKKNYYGQVNRIKSIRAKNINGIKVGEYHYSVANTKKKHALKDNLREAETAYYNTPLGKREARAEKAKANATKVKNWVKDKLGYDEKQAMETAKVEARVKLYKAEDVHSENNEWKRKNPNSENVKELADWQTNYHYELANEAMKKATKAVKTYEKTPLAKIEKASAKIEDAKDWFNDLFGKKTTTKESDPDVRPIEVKPIEVKPITVKENVVKENVLKENVLYEEVIDSNGNRIETKRKKKR